MADGRGILRIAALALIAFGVWYLAGSATGLPSPRGLDAAPTEFSAARADATLGRLLGPEVPHPVSSAANVAVQGRIRAEFAALGIKTAVYRALGCNGRPKYGFFACGTVEDVIAEVAPGQGKAIVLMAHYDSVPAGPGASDDQSGVATIIETVRTLKARGLASMHPIVALLTDGEEAGLLGASAFLANPALKARVGVVINVEARGNQGPSLLFQTSPGDGPLIDLYAASVPEFATSSLFAVIYKLLPNDTDLTPFLAQGFTGYNFAFSGNVADYHSTLDRRANLSLATLQHHGDNALGVASALMRADFAKLQGGDDVYLTLFGHVLPRLPASWALPLAIVAFFVLALTAWLSRGEVLGLGRRLAAVAMPLAAILGGAAIGWLLHLTAQLVSGQPDPSYAHPIFLRFALALGVAVAAILASRLAGARMAALSVWLWIAVLAIATAALLPGLSPYFLFPVLIAAPLLLLQSRLSGAWSGTVGQVVLFVAALPALLIWLSLAAAGESLQGLALHPLFTIPAGFAVIALLPLLAAHPLGRRTWLALSGGVAAAAVVVAAVAGLQPAYSAIAPQRLNIDFVDDHDANKGYWAIETGARLPPVYRFSHGAFFSDAPQPISPLLRQSAYVMPAGATRFALPTATIVSKAAGAGRIVSLALHGSSGANRMVVVVPKDSGLVRAAIAGQTFDPDPGSLNPAGTILACVTDDCRDQTFTLTFASRAPVAVTIGEQHYGVSREGTWLAEARPAYTAASQSGDTTNVFGKVVLP